MHSDSPIHARPRCDLDLDLWCHGASRLSTVPWWRDYQIRGVGRCRVRDVHQLMRVCRWRMKPMRSAHRDNLAFNFLSNVCQDFHGGIDTTFGEVDGFRGLTAPLTATEQLQKDHGPEAKPIWSRRGSYGAPARGGALTSSDPKLS